MAAMMWKYKYFVLAAAFVLLGCQKIIDAGSYTDPAFDGVLWTVMAKNGEGLRAAVENDSVGTIELESDLDASAVDLNIRAAKSIVIPADVTLSVRSVNAAANAGISNKGSAAEESSQKAAKSASGSAESGILRINGEFYVAKDAVFEVKKDITLVFGSTVKSVTVDGLLKCEQEDSVYALASGTGVYGEGYIETGEAGAKAAAEFELKIAADEGNEGGGGNKGGEGNDGGGGGLDSGGINFNFGTTVNNTSNFALGSVSGANISCAAETGGQTGTDEYDPNVYFKVRTESPQSIAVGGADAAYITAAPAGNTVDGSTAEGTINVFTVRPKPVTGGNGEMLDTQFDGGVYNFTLAAGGKSVNITLSVAPNLTGTAVFLVNAKTAADAAKLGAGVNVLTRLGGIRQCEVIGDSIANTTISVSATDAPASGNYLLSALNYVNTAADSHGKEYLIRVEQDEALPRIALTCNKPATADNAVTVRLRGGGAAERKITYNDTGALYRDQTLMYESGETNYNFGFIIVGYQLSLNTYFVTLALENNITVSGDNNVFTSGDFGVLYLVTVASRAKLVMRDGSRLTGYVYNTSVLAAVGLLEVKCSYIANFVNTGKFEMRGGEITGNNVGGGSSYANVLISLYGGDKDSLPNIAHCFEKTGGKIYGNNNDYLLLGVTGGTTPSYQYYHIPESEGAWTVSESDKAIGDKMSR
jgi:hypothetical protein